MPIIQFPEPATNHAHEGLSRLAEMARDGDVTDYFCIFLDADGDENINMTKGMQEDFQVVMRCFTEFLILLMGDNDENWSTDHCES